MEFSHSTSVAKIDARHSTAISEYLITQHEPKRNQSISTQEEKFRNRATKTLNNRYQWKHY